MVFLSKSFLWVHLIFLSVAQAAPPVDVTSPEFTSVDSTRKAKPKDSDFEMLDVNDPQVDIEKDAATILFDVMGRSRPSREGLAILRCIKHDRVRFLKFSSDKKWVAIQSLRSGKKAWVPVGALDRKFEKKTK